jgi:hypothetical protein
MKTWLGDGANGCERAFQNQRLTVELGCHLCSNGGAEGAAEGNRLRRIDALRIARKVERRFTVEISAFFRGRAWRCAHSLGSQDENIDSGFFIEQLDVPALWPMSPALP